MVIKSVKRGKTMLPEVVSYPAKTRALLIREPLIAICENAPNANCAGAILASFEYWTRTKTASNEQGEIHNDIAMRGGLPADQDTELWIYKSAEDLVQDILGFFSDKTVRDNVAWLVEKELLKRRNNPKFAWDRTYQYLFNIELVQQQINQLHLVTLPEHSVALPNQSGKDTAAIPKTTSKTTSREKANTYSDAHASESPEPTATSKTVGKEKQTDTPHQDSLFAHNDPDDQPSPVVKRVPVKSAPTHPLRKQHKDAQGRKYNPYNNVITAFWLGKDPKNITPADSENTWGQIARMFKIDGAWQLLYDEVGGFTPYELQVALYKWTQHPKNKEIAVVGRRPSWDKLYGHVAETIRVYVRQQRQQGN